MLCAYYTLPDCTAPPPPWLHACFVFVTTLLHMRLCSPAAAGGPPPRGQRGGAGGCAVGAVLWGSPAASSSARSAAVVSGPGHSRVHSRLRRWGAGAHLPGEVRRAGRGLCRPALRSVLCRAAAALWTARGRGRGQSGRRPAGGGRQRAEGGAAGRQGSRATGRRAAGPGRPRKWRQGKRQGGRADRLRRRATRGCGLPSRQRPAWPPRPDP